MKADLIERQHELTLYKFIVESFFDLHYPELEKQKFWKWVVFNLTGQAKALDELQAGEIAVVLSRLEEVGELLFDPDYLMGAFKGGAGRD